MTPRQAECLKFIAEYIGKNGFSSSMAEIVLALGMKSKSQASGLVKALTERGYLRRERGKSRALVPVASDVAPVAGEFERGRSLGFKEGYRAALARGS